MRFVFVDRLVAVDPGRRIETLKNVSMTEDVFVDHFPGHPILPGALVVESFHQAAQLLIALSHEFTQVGRLTRLSRVAFRRFVRPGDQLRLRCERRPASEAWVLAASADVDGRRVATATLEYELAPVRAGTATAAQADRLSALARELQQSPLDVAARGLQA